MEITCKGKVIKNMPQWENVVSRRHWVQGRSAYSLADYILNKGGIKEIKDLVKDITGLDYEFEAEIEKVSKFDQYNSPRQHDLGIKGKTVDGKTIFIGLEAKVNESYGSYSIASYYNYGLKKRKEGSGTHIPERIDGLLKLIFPKDTPPNTKSTLRYQLHHATAGTLHEQADIRIFLILTFITNLYSTTDGIRNNKHLVDFVNSIEPKSEIGYRNNIYRLVTIDNKKLHIIHKEIPFI